MIHYDGELKDFISPREFIQKCGVGKGGRVQKVVDAAVIRESTPYVPYDEGILAGSANTATEIGSGEVVYDTPYARYQWYGEVYTDDIGINLDYQIEKFTRKSVTGRQLMKWLAEIACSYCRADPEGLICFSWYTPADAQITPTGDSYYFQNGLSYEDYAVAPVEAVQLRLADSENGALWPPADEGANSYVITGNPILTRNLDQEILQPVLDNIRARLARATYTPCKVSVPASMNIHAGNSVQITDKNGVTLTAYVMTKTQAGQKDILESTGSARRDSSSAVNNKTQAEKDAAMEDYADSAADKAVKAQTADEVLRRLTNDYQIQGLWQQDGEWYFNAQAVHVLNLVANLITAGKLQSVDKKIYFDLDSGEIVAIGDSGGVSIKDGQFVYEAPGAKGKISFGAFGGDMGGPAIMVKDSVGTNKVGIVSFNGESYFLCKNVDTFAFSIGSIGRKTISYLDANGNVQTEDFYVSY